MPSTAVVISPNVSNPLRVQTRDALARERTANTWRTNRSLKAEGPSCA
jgi:hypothetical protein